MAKTAKKATSVANEVVSNPAKESKETLEKKAPEYKLTQKDIDSIPHYVKKWIDIGLSTGRANRPFIEEQVKEAYRVVGLEPPARIEWFDSPYAGGMRVKELIGKDKYSSIFSDVIYGQHDADWMAFYDFFDNCENIDFKEIVKVYPLMNISKECGWWWPFDEVAIMTERPTEVHLDQSNRLHGEAGPAIAYADGFAVYSWHGYRIPVDKEWIIKEPARVTPDAVEAEGNAELRRIMLEAYGFENYLKARQYNVISNDTDGSGNPRRLLEITVANEKLRVLEVLNSSLEPDGSRRKFFLGAMPGNTPHESVAASFGISPNFYNEEACS
jgi:hypothetical protein